MTGLTGMSIIQFYDHVFVSEYVKLKQFAHHNTDQLHTVYCNVKQRLEKSVIDTGKTVNEAYCNVLNYIRKSIANERRLEHKKKRDVRSITEDGYMYDAELQLNVLEEILEDDVVYRNQVNHIMANLWDFLDKYHDPYEIYVFKVYYFSGQKLSYKDISILLNIKEWKIDNILKATRKSIREKLIKYMEEKELYTQIKELMRTGIPREKFYIAVDLYKQAFPDKIKGLCLGCKGRSINIMAADFKVFLTINKHKYEKS